MDSSQQEGQQQQPPQQHVILFYKYHPLSDDPSVTDEYRVALHNLCQSLQLTGRILVGCSSTSEGINGTLAGSYHSVKAFTIALSPPMDDGTSTSPTAARDESGDAAVQTMLDQECAPFHRDVIKRYRDASQTFFNRISCPVLALQAHEFKWSAVPSSSTGTATSSCRTTNNDGDSGPTSLFPDLNVKLVDELIGSGGAMKQVSIDETSKGYLTPDEWHDAIAGRDPNHSVLIDCRNHKEYEIGHFASALNPQTTTYSQFPQWVEQNQHIMENKTVYMYCTGGIRCEKSAAYIRRVVPSAVGVHHLQGGIHKYLETYGGSDHASAGTTSKEDVGTASQNEPSLWRGRNFVFDGRGAASAEETYLGRDGTAASDPILLVQVAESQAVVGRCSHCDQPFDRFDPHCVCTVCREPTLVCAVCQKELVEYHCRQHHHLRHCYFYDLSRYSVSDLEQQIQDLHSVLADIAVGKRFKSKRKTLLKQITKVHDQVSMLRSQERAEPASPTGWPPCRNCGDLECSGRCWGFYGLKRKQLLEHQSSKDDALESGVKHAKVSEPVTLPGVSRKPPVHKGRNRQDEINEIAALGLSRPPSVHRDARSRLRVVPPVTRTVHCRAKGKWCGRLAVQVLKEEFAELSRPGVLNELLGLGLVRINGAPLDLANSCHVRLRMRDTLSRVVHWHEPPVQVPERIPVQRLRLDDSVLRAHGLEPAAEAALYVVNKPASVPVHPAGPYLANSLAMMVEAQEELLPTTLIPLHRTDRATSGLTLFATHPSLSRVFHTSLSVPGAVHKLYLAKVCGRFYGRDVASKTSPDDLPSLPIGTCYWINDRVFKVDAPVETIDPANGIRAVTMKGKPSTSLFQWVSYDSANDTSLIACVPVTGRNHQLRVHLQLLNCPVLGDVQYGGRPWMESMVPKEVTMSLMCQSASIGKTETGDTKSAGVECATTASSSLTDADVTCAQKACRVCRILEDARDGDTTTSSEPTGSTKHDTDDDDDDDDDSTSTIFSAAQMLQGGHAIALHALRYQVSMYGPQSKKKAKQNKPAVRTSDSQQQDDEDGSNPTTSPDKQDDVDEPLWVCDVRVDPPWWWCRDDGDHPQPSLQGGSDFDALFEMSDLSAFAT